MGNFTLHTPLVAVSADEFVPKVRTWVKLRERLSEYSCDEALLLCEEANGQWLLWVPDFGVATLSREQLCGKD